MMKKVYTAAAGDKFSERANASITGTREDFVLLRKENSLKREGGRGASSYARYDARSNSLLATHTIQWNS